MWRKREKKAKSKWNKRIRSNLYDWQQEKSTISVCSNTLWLFGIVTGACMQLQLHALVCESCAHYNSLYLSISQCALSRCMINLTVAATHERCRISKRIRLVFLSRLQIVWNGPCFGRPLCIFIAIWFNWCVLRPPNTASLVRCYFVPQLLVHCNRNWDQIVWQANNQKDHFNTLRARWNCEQLPLFCRWVFQTFFMLELYLHIYTHCYSVLGSLPSTFSVVHILRLQKKKTHAHAELLKNDLESLMLFVWFFVLICMISWLGVSRGNCFPKSEMNFHAIAIRSFF